MRPIGGGLSQDARGGVWRPQDTGERPRRRVAAVGDPATDFGEIGGRAEPGSRRLPGSSPTLRWPEAGPGGYRPRSKSRDFCFAPAALSSSDSRGTPCRSAPPRSPEPGSSRVCSRPVERASDSPSRSLPVFHSIWCSGPRSRRASRSISTTGNAARVRARVARRRRFRGRDPSRRRHVSGDCLPVRGRLRGRTRSPRQPVSPSRRAPRAAPPVALIRRSASLCASSVTSWAASRALEIAT